MELVLQSRRRKKLAIDMQARWQVTAGLKA